MTRGRTCPRQIATLPDEDQPAAIEYLQRVTKPRRVRPAFRAPGTLHCGHRDPEDVVDLDGVEVCAVCNNG